MDKNINPFVLSEMTYQFNSPSSQHFLGGTRITLNNQGGEVIENDGSGTLTIGWDDGSISTIKPIALNRRK